MGCRRYVPSVSPSCPLAGEKRNYVGMQGISSRPQGPGACQLLSSLPGSHLGSEKYWRLWLTELFFRFEPAPHFDSNLAGKGKRYPGSAPRGQGAGGQGTAGTVCALPSSLAGWDWGALAASLSRDGGVALPSPLAPSLVVEDRMRFGPQRTSFKHQNRTRKMLGKNLLFPNECRNHRRDGKGQSCGTSLHEVNNSACFYSKFPGGMSMVTFFRV